MKASSSSSSVRGVERNSRSVILVVMTVDLRGFAICRGAGGWMVILVCLKLCLRI
jgi:hypothetical protein